jgi:hypothetical protein
LTPDDDPKIPAWSLASENLPQFNLEEFPHLPLEKNTAAILNGFSGF